MPLTLKNFYRVITGRTFTVTFTESTNPSNFNPVYSDDAAGLTAGSTDFDEFFGYSAVRLDANGVETDEITQADSGGNGKLDITQLGTLTSGDNVMIKFPRLGIKMEKNGSTCTLSITSKENEAGYQYYAHTRGNDIKNAFYLGAYKSFNSSNVLKSWSGQSPAVNLTLANSRSYSEANGTGYDEIAIYQRMFINALYMMKFGNPDSQSIIGMGYVSGNSATTTGNTNSQTAATYGTTSGYNQCKLFGLEDWWGNLYEWVDGIIVNGSYKVFTSINNTSFNDNGSGYSDSGVTVGSFNGNISTIACTNNGMFLPTATGGNNSQYWCDTCYTNSAKLGVFGGSVGSNNAAGAFMVSLNQALSFYADFVGTRLMYL